MSQSREQPVDKEHSGIGMIAYADHVYAISIWNSGTLTVKEEDFWSAVVFI